MVEERGRIAARGTAGRAQEVPVKRKMAQATLFDLASLTKPIVTGTCCMVLWQRGELSIEMPVRHYLPEFGGGWRNRVLVSQVLSHSSGLPSGLPLSKLCASPSEVLDRVCEAKMEYHRGSKTLYSDVGFILLGKLIERMSGVAIDALAKREVFDPLGMRMTMYKPGEELRELIAATEDVRSRGGVLVGEVHDGNAHFMGGVSGHAGLFSCVGDLARYCRMMLGRGPRVLSQDTVALATRVWADDGSNAFGLSWFKRRSPIDPAGNHFSEMAYGHTGHTGTSIWIEPTRDLFAILLTNRVHPDSAPDRIPEMNRLRAQFHDLALAC